MAVLNIALVAALLPAVLAIPQHGSMYHSLHRASKPSGGWPYPTDGPFQSSQVPFPAGNSTAGAATATGTGLVTIKSTINLIPVPVTSSILAGGQSPASTGAGGAGGSGQSGSPGSPSGTPGQAGDTCGPATVTVTTANTVTVTVEASPSSSPIQSAQPSSTAQSSVVPFALYNSSILTGPTDTGGLSTSYVAPTPPSSSLATSSAVVQQASDSQVLVPVTPIGPGAAAITPSSVAVKADYHQAGAAPNAAAKAPHYVPAPASSQPVSSAVSAPIPPPASSQPLSSAVPSPVPSPASTTPSGPASSSPTSTSGSGGSTGVKARGLLYSYNNQQLSPADALAQANDAVSDAIGWMANWDSSPSPGSGQASGSGKVEYVAQLWGTDATHLTAWQTNAKTPWLMSFNEPDNCGGGGACLSLQDAADAHTAHIAPLRTGSTKVTTPCTQNNVASPGIGSDYMASFLAKFPSNSFDAIAFHWYGPGTQEGLNGSDNPQSLAATVSAYQKLQKQYGIAELWITEGGPENASPDMLNTFLEWLDDPSNGVDRYLWNGLNSPTSVVQIGAGSKYMS